MGLDQLSVDQRHVLDEQAENALPLTRLDGRVVPYSWKVGGQREQLLPRPRVNQQALLLRLLLVVLLRFGQATELVIPFRFQAVGNQSVAGVDIHVTPAGKLGFVLCPLDVFPPQRIGFGNPCLDFLLNGEGNLQSHWLHQFQQEVADRLIDDTARHALADLLRPPDGGFLADIGGNHLLIRDAVVDAHSLSTDAAYDAALQERRALACRPRFPCSSEPQRVLGEALLIGLKLLPADVAGMSTGNQDLPIRSRNLRRTVLSVRQKASAAAAVDERAGVAGVVQHLEDSRVLRPHPMQLTLVHPFANAAREPETLLVKQFHRLHCRSSPVEGLEDQAERGL